MNKKIKLIILTIIISLFIYGCSIKAIDMIPSTITLEESIKEIIISKGENYDFLSDELFINKVNELGLSNNFTVGNLDEDSIPELVVFVERNPDDTDDQGRLDVYKFSGEKYEILDSVDMNYDNSNYLLVVGKISPSQNGIYLSNQVGAQASVNYGYILENGKLKNILNDKKVSLISIDTSNEIKDIDNDGVLEFSIYTIDPETKEQSSVGSDKLILWYKWDENDSGKLVQIDRIPREAPLDNSPKLSNNSQINISEDVLIPNLLENISQYDKYEITDLVKNHIENLSINLNVRGIEVDSLFAQYQVGSNYDRLVEKYSLSNDRLNDLEYLKREKVFQSEQDLKNHLIKYIGMGYKLDSSEGMYYYVINHQKFINAYGEFITKEYKDYLNIKAKETNEPFLRDAALVLSREKLAERIVDIESFRLTYPYSNFLDEVNKLYVNYVLVFIYGSNNTPNYDEGNKFSDGAIAVFNNTINKYPGTHFADILKEFINSISPNLNVLAEDAKEKLNNLIK